VVTLEFAMWDQFGRQDGMRDIEHEAWVVRHRSASAHWMECELGGL